MKLALCLPWLLSLASLASQLVSVDSRTVSLRVQPDQCIFEQGNSLSLTCEDSSGLWAGPESVFRNTTKETSSQCGGPWGRLNESECRIRALLSEYDSGLYWCVTAHGASSEAINITVTERQEQNISTACPPPPPGPSTVSPAPPPAGTWPAWVWPAWVWPVLGSALGLFLVLVLVLVLLVLPMKRSRWRTEEQNGRPEEITYSELHVSHDRSRPIRRDQGSEPSPVYSTVKTQDVCYSSVKKTRGSEPSPVYSTVKTQDVCYSSVKKTRDQL